MSSTESSSRPSVGFWEEAAVRAEAVVAVLMHGAEHVQDLGDEVQRSVTCAADPERAFYELENLFVSACGRLQNFAGDEGHLDVRRGSILSVAHGFRMTMRVEIGGYNAGSRMLTVRVTRRASLKSVWAVLKVPAIVGRGWWVAGFSVDEPPNWPEMEAPSEA
jgi:hypothetical protein